MGEFDTEEEAKRFANKLLYENNPLEDIKSTWCSNTYVVNVNTLSIKGRELLDKFK